MTLVMSLVLVYTLDVKAEIRKNLEQQSIHFFHTNTLVISIPSYSHMHMHKFMCYFQIFRFLYNIQHGQRVWPNLHSEGHVNKSSFKYPCVG